MKILLVGATGAIGKRLVPLLVGAGHTVTGTTRQADKAMLIYSSGATPLVVNGVICPPRLAYTNRTPPKSGAAGVAVSGGC